MKIPIDLKSGQIIGESTKDVIVGIDLGTTNSLIAYMDGDQAKTIKSSAHQNVLTPSIVHFAENGDIFVGEKAGSLLVSAPERTVFSVKRLMGKSYHDIESYKSSLGYEILDENKDTLVKIKVGNKFYTPIQLSAEILKSLKKDGEKHLGQKISKAVITVPAYFNDAQRQATRDAGKLAGLDVLRIVNEPTAASLAYGFGLDKKSVHTVAVYDLGGGTFDISILHIEEGIFEVLATHGNTSLGGDDIDRLIMKYWTDQDADLKTNIENDASTNQAFRLVSEQAKKHLSNQEKFETTFLSYTLSLDRSKFDDLITPLIQLTLESCKNALKDASLNTKDIDKVIFVGGATRIPYIKTMLTDFFGQVPDDSLNPDEVVALGAAIQADILAGNRKDILLLDVTPLSLGIETVGGLMDTIIPRNAKVPHRAGRQYTTSVDGQKNLRISVYQGERDLVSFNRKLGEFVLNGLPPMAAGFPKIEVQFILDADGILTVKASELRSGTATSVAITSTYGITEEEMALMLIDSIQHASEDVEKRALLEAINEGNNIVLAAQKFIIQNKDIISDEEVQETKKLTQNLADAIQNKNKDEIENAMKSLNEYTTPLAHQALDVQISKALKGSIIE